ncbi:hypothetical protein ABPG77_007516 [Micractinium sp. CCAP 211/92]
MEEGLETTALQLTREPALSQASTDFLAGGVAGACGVVAGQPLDTVRIRQQAQRGAAGMGASSLARSILRAEGAGAFFRGMAYPLTTAALQNAVVFQAYGAAARFLTDASQQEPAAAAAAALSLPQVFWAGCFAGGVQTAVIVPVDLLKIRLQLQTAVRGTPGYVGPLSLLGSILRTEGVAGLYRGTVITSIRDLPSHGVYFACYEAARQLMQRPDGSHAALALWAAGGLAGAVSWFSVYPFDVLKTRLQAGAAASSPYKGWVDCARQSYATEGTTPFFRGLSTTLGRAFLVNGAIFTAYELSHKLLSS